MARFSWNDEKNYQLQQERGISFEEIVVAIESDGLLDTLEHHNPTRYPRQQLLVVLVRTTLYVVPFAEEEDGTYFLKTIYPSRKIARHYGY